MCGIAGAINSNFSYTEVIKAMYHRGPDAQNGYQSRNVNFFHLRLSIMDIGGGKQPMNFEDKYTIIFNGEIYNHSELKERFNIKAQTNSDTETLLWLYHLYGVKFLQYLDGMFVLAIHDKVKNEVFIARDRAGKKPLYYYIDNEKIVFASELNCLKTMVPLEIENANIFQYFRLGSFYRKFTPYKNVKELGSGSFLIINTEEFLITETRWWNINDYYKRKSTDSVEESLSKTDDFLHSAIKRRLESSDLEVGSFLSGGIDSGLVTAIASGYRNNLKTFTVSFDGAYNEAPLARLVAEKYQTHHTEISISFQNLKYDIEKILSNYGEPFFDSSCIPSYYVSREAKKFVTVVLNGDGADELFGGYRRYVPFSHYDFFKKNFLIQKTAGFFQNILPASGNKKSIYNYLHRLASLASNSGLEIYLSAGVDIFEDYQQYIIDPGFDYLETIRDDFDKIANSNLSGLQKIMNLDFDTNLFGDLLVKMDIATMANSQEGRSAFLCKELLEYIPSLPDNYKIKGQTTKFLLRQLAIKYLPSQLINQPKRGFEIPLKDWINTMLKETVFDYLSCEDNLYSNFINKKFVESLLQQKIKMSGEKRAKILWTLTALEIWYKKVYKVN